MRGHISGLMYNANRAGASGVDAVTGQIVEEVAGRKAKTGLEQLMEGYRLCAASEGKSAKYISIVTTSIRSLIQFLRAENLPIDVTEIEPQHLRMFVRYLQSAHRYSDHPFARPQSTLLAPHTVNTYMRSLRSFWSWLEIEGIIADNPFVLVKIPKAPWKIVPTFSEEQIGALVAQIDTSSPTGFRDYCIIMILLDTMIRVGELTGSCLSDLNLQGRCSKVRGKGSKERMVPFGRTAQKALWKYVTFHRPDPWLPNRDTLFLADDGRPLTKNRVEAMLKAYGRRAGITGVRVSPHTFRHTGAVSFLRNGGDLFSLQRIMGHSRLEVLRGYVNLSQDDLKRAHERASPLDNLKLPPPRGSRPQGHRRSTDCSATGQRAKVKVRGRQSQFPLSAAQAA